MCSAGPSTRSGLPIHHMCNHVDSHPRKLAQRIMLHPPHKLIMVFYQHACDDMIVRALLLSFAG